ncbi:hypothetical protein EES42_00900 [Streptomyces sp. ADI95-17]|nr:hypothetical protein EES42_00900 [Streptomyces sp. ADI95-17]
MATVVCARETCAETLCFFASFLDGTGVCVRHSAFCGLLSAQAGRETRPRRDPQLPPIVSAKVE